jgi:hypothetical protein
MTNNGDLGKISEWLDEMGVHSIERKSSSTLRVNLQTTPPKIQYSLFFHCEKDEYLFENFVFKSVSGDPEKVATFYEMVLGYNDYLRPLGFAIVQVDGGWRITLSGTQECSLFNPFYLEKILNLYNEFYVNHYSRIEDMANELGLTFSGNSCGPLGLVLRAMLHDD